MSWTDSLFDASFRGVPFDCRRTTDSLDRDVSRYAYPHIDGEDIEDQGLRARDVSLTAMFFGDDYEQRMNALLGALAEKGPGELIHPVFGSLPTMQFLGGHVSHDAENPDACLIDMRFAAATPGNPFFADQLPGQKADATAQQADAARQAASSAFDDAVDALKTAHAGFRRMNALRDEMVDSITPLKNLVSDFKSTTQDYLDVPGGFASDVTGLVSSMTNFRSFDPGLVMSDWNGLQDQMEAVAKLPAAAASGHTVAIPGAPPASGAMNAPDDPSAPYSPTPPSSVAADPHDVALVSTLFKTVVATVTAQVASDVLANEVDTPTLSPVDIEQIANDTREQIQHAIDAARAAMEIELSRPFTEQLKDTALSVQELAEQVIDALPPIITRTVASDANLTLLAHLWYGDYRRSAELQRLNPFVHNPNFIRRGEVLRGFAR